MSSSGKRRKKKKRTFLQTQHIHKPITHTHTHSLACLGTAAMPQRTSILWKKRSYSSFLLLSFLSFPFLPPPLSKTLDRQNHLHLRSSQLTRTDPSDKNTHLSIRLAPATAHQTRPGRYSALFDKSCRGRGFRVDGFAHEHIYAMILGIMYVFCIGCSRGWVGSVVKGEERGGRERREERGERGSEKRERRNARDAELEGERVRRDEIDSNSNRLDNRMAKARTGYKRVPKNCARE